MCGRYTLKKRPEELRKKVPFQGDSRALSPRYNIAPTQWAPVITADRKLTLMRWGLIPSWAKDPAIGNRMINARSETLDIKPAFGRLLRHHRCLIPADGFYEWKKIGRGKQPYYIQINQGEPFAMAGLWDHWQDPHGTELETFTIITTEAPPVMRELHPRMPAILAPGAQDQWLDHNSPCDPLPQLLTAWTENNLSLTPVNPLVNSPAHDDPRCVQPLQIPPASPLPTSSSPQNLELDL